MRSNLNLYTFLSSIPLLNKSYVAKFMIISFIGIHFPLIGTVAFLLLNSSVETSIAWQIFLIILLATLVATSITLYVLYGLLKPISLTSSMLRNYIESGTLPNLPRQHKDEVGQLMTDVQSTINHLQSTIHEIDILSSMDGLTNIFNRMAGERRLAQDVARANREGLNIFIAMIDIDNFKSINDEHGHQAGDACIKHLAQELSNTIRQGDWVARWGGDEFMLALWNQDINSAKQSYERILNAVHLSPMHHNGLDINLHISIGVKKYHPDLGIDSCINEADKMLYEVKRSGGGAVMLAD